MNRIKTLAAKLVADLKSRCPFEIAEALGITVYYAPLPDGINGFYFEKNERNFICINQDTDEYYHKTICAHELGHFFLHRELNAFVINQSSLLLGSKYEKQADLFAACLLINDDSECADCLTISAVSALNGVPEKIAMLKYTVE